MVRQERLERILDNELFQKAVGAGLFVSMAGGLGITFFALIYGQHVKDEKSHIPITPTPITDSEDMQSFENSFNSPQQLKLIPQQNPQ